MMDFFRKKIWQRRLCAKLRKECQPRPEFLESCRASFIKKLCERFPMEAEAPRRFIYGHAFRYGTASVLGLMFLGSGAAVYADKTNVNSSHPLYGLKRVAETVRLTLAPVSQSPILHTQFAARRLQEIKAINLAPPPANLPSGIKTTDELMDGKMKVQISKQNQKMAELRTQMRQEIDSAISEIEQKQVGKTSAKNVCVSVSQIMKEDEQADGEEVKAMYLENWAKVNKNCHDF